MVSVDVKPTVSLQRAREGTLTLPDPPPVLGHRRELHAELLAPRLLVTFSQAFHLSTVLCNADWASARWSEADSSVQTKVICLTGLLLISLVINGRTALLILKLLFGTHRSLPLWLCFSSWAKYGGRSSGFSRGIYLRRSDWLKMFGWIAARNPLLSSLIKGHCGWCPETVPLDTTPVTKQHAGPCPDGSLPALLLCGCLAAGARSAMDFGRGWTLGCW